MESYKGKLIPDIRDTTKIRLGFLSDIHSAPYIKAGLCSIGKSIDWKSSRTVNCHNDDCEYCIFGRFNLDIGVAYLLREHLIAKEEALKFCLDSLNKGE